MSQPSNSGRPRKPHRAPLATEHALQCALMDYLPLAARMGVYWFSIPNAGKRSPGAVAWFSAEGLRAGVADLCFLLPEGKCAWLELKRSPRHKQTLEQITFGQVCAKLRHPYAVAHSFEEACSILREWDVLPPPKETQR